MNAPLVSPVFLKLGGSLITEKDRPHTPRLETLARLSAEIAQARASDPNLSLLVGHGSGSFGHIPAQRHQTRQGVYSSEQWAGFVEVWREAWELNSLVMRALNAVGLSALAFAPVAALQAQAGQVQAWNLGPIQAALSVGLLPVVYGDVVFDLHQGGTILSTEDLFGYLALRLKPKRILLAGLEAGVWADYPACKQLIKEIAPGSLSQITDALGGSTATDVTGGMLSKVQAGLEWVSQAPGLEVWIFSGEEPGNVRAALLGQPMGTRLRAE